MGSAAARRSFGIVATVFVSALLVAGAGTARAQERRAGPSQLAPAQIARLPEFEEARLRDGVRVPSSSYEGKVTLINFWGVWCPPCVEELPYLADVYDRYRDHPDVRIVAIHHTIDRSRSEVRAWAEARDVLGTVPMLYDADGSTREAFGSGGIPRNYFVDSDGRVVGTLDDRPHATFAERAIRQIERMLAE